MRPTNEKLEQRIKMLEQEAERHRQSESINKTLYAISNAVSTTSNLTELYKTIHISLSHIIDVTNFYIGLYHEERDSIVILFYSDQTSDDFKELVNISKSDSLSLTYEVVKTRKPLLIQKKDLEAWLTRENRKPCGRIPEIWIGVPLKIRNKVMGVIATQSYTNSNQYTQKDVDLLVSVSNQVALAIDRKKYEEELNIHRNHLEILVNNRTAELTELNKELQKEIDDRKYAEQSLSESENRYYQLFENELDATIVFDAETLQFEDVNKAALELYGYSKEEFINLKAHDISTEKEKTKTDLQKIKDSESKTVRVPVHYFKKKNGATFPGEVNSSAFASGGRKKIISSIRDITKRLKLEKELRQAQKMEAIGTLAGGIAHDFNNILSSIIGFTELAIDDTSENTLLQDNLHEVMIASSRARDLVQQILTFSRQTEQDQKAVQIKIIVREAIKLLRATLPSTIAIRQNIESDSMIMADPIQIHQVIMNLCTNASHAMIEKGGVLEVNLEDVEFDKWSIPQKKAIKPGKYLNLTVSDTGHGIPRSIITRIFDPFFTTKPQGEGSGMGLSVVHGIITDLNGMILPFSESGKGSTFKIYFPVIESEYKQNTDDGATLPKGTECILLIDDEHQVAKMGGQLLNSLGYDVTIKTNSIEAFELFTTESGNFDLVITDLTMPNMSGDDLTMEIKKINPHTPVILYSGFSTKINEKRIQTIGADAFVTKPILKKDFAKLIREILDKVN